MIRWLAAALLLILVSCGADTHGPVAAKATEPTAELAAPTPATDSSPDEGDSRGRVADCLGGSAQTDAVLIECVEALTQELRAAKDAYLASYAVVAERFDRLDPEAGWEDLAVLIAELNPMLATQLDEMSELHADWAVLAEESLERGLVLGVEADPTSAKMFGEYVSTFGRWVKNHQRQNADSLRCASFSSERHGFRCFVRSLLRVGTKGTELAERLDRLQRGLF